MEAQFKSSKTSRGSYLYLEVSIFVKIFEFCLVIQSVLQNRDQIQCLFDLLDPGWVQKQDPDPGLTSRIRNTGPTSCKIMPSCLNYIELGIKECKPLLSKSMRLC
jgi:hypothetical protein